jgi:GTPase SAR1 family protein
MFKLSHKRIPILFFLVALAIIGAIPVNFAIEIIKQGPAAVDLAHKDQLYLVHLTYTYTYPYIANSILILGFLIYLIGWILQSQQFPQEESQKAHETLSDRNRRILIANIRQFVDVQLNQLLHDRPLLARHMHNRTNLVLTSLSQDSISSDISSDMTLLQWFDASQSRLLILGEPGMGKTTSLLSLAQSLLERAEKDTTSPIPILLNLSSWTHKNKSLEEWIITEVSKSGYDIPQRLTLNWLKNRSLLLLLDGLDEVSEAIRSECVHSINLYNSTKDTLPPIATCCNIQEYTLLTEPLQVNQAISLDPLTDEQIKLYLDDLEKEEELRHAIDKEPTLHGLSQIPLMLNMLALCSSNAYTDISNQNSFEEQRRTLFEHYVATRLDYQSKIQKQHITSSQSHQYLSWIATTLEQHKETLFSLPWLQPRLLNHQGIYRLLIMIIDGVMGGVIGWLIGRLAGELHYWIIGGISFGLVWGLAHGLDDIENRDRPLVDTDKMIRFLGDSLAIGLGMGIIMGIINGVIGKFNFDIVDGVIIGIGVSLIVGLIISIMDGIGTRLGIGVALPLSLPTHLKNRANKNIIQMGKDGFVCGLGIGLVSGIGIGLGGGLEIGVTIGIVIWIIVGLGLGLIDYLRHYLMRFMLAREKSLPFNMVTFLNNSAQSMILRHLGGEYSFIHESLREYFVHKQEG